MLTAYLPASSLLLSEAVAEFAEAVAELAEAVAEFELAVALEAELVSLVDAAA